MICKRQPAIPHPHQDGPYLRVGLGFGETKTAVCLSREVHLLRHCTPHRQPRNSYGTARLLVVRKGEIMLVNGILMATSWLLTPPALDAKAEAESISPTSNTAKLCWESEVCGKPADRYGTTRY